MQACLEPLPETNCPHMQRRLRPPAGRGPCPVNQRDSKHNSESGNCSASKRIVVYTSCTNRMRRTRKESGALCISPTRPMLNARVCNT